LITNLICYKLDKELSKLAFNNNCTVTRYVDDITFSFNCSHDKIPRDILDGISGESISISKKLVNIINKNGFEINYKKVRLSSSNQRQQVTGIVTNVKVNLPRKYIKKTQSMLYAWKNFSLPNAEQAHINNYLEKPYKYQRFIRYNKDKSYFNLMIKGRINYIGMVRGQSDCIYRKLLYQYTELIGNPNKELLKSVDDCLADSVFITEYPIESKQGTAFFLKDIGLVTAAHVVEGIHETNSCFLDFFRHYEVKIKRKATLFKKSEEKDIAIFYVGDDFKNLPSLKVGDDSKLAIGDQIKLIGFPDYNYHDSYLSNLGKIIQKKTMYNLDVWIVDLPINFGVSGGPVFNNKNEVIGVALQGSKKHDQSTYSHYFVPISKVIEMAQN
ncbi:TPA: trypsin-like serine protease, partial [Legionella pneumophila]|nr:trypsin-like serine protease [Legionella pneumophila]